MIFGRLAEVSEVMQHKHCPDRVRMVQLEQPLSTMISQLDGPPKAPATAQRRFI